MSKNTAEVKTPPLRSSPAKVYAVPLTWAEIVAKTKRREIFYGRSREKLAEYQLHKQKVAEEWDSIDSYCRSRYFNLQPTSLVDHKKSLDAADAVTLQQHADDVTTCQVNLCVNDFPYYVEEGVEHWVLWSLSHLGHSAVMSEVHKRFPSSSYDVCLQENPLEVKSVKSIWHVHVFARLKLVSV